MSNESSTNPTQIAMWCIPGAIAGLVGGAIVAVALNIVLAIAHQFPLSPDTKPYKENQMLYSVPWLGMAVGFICPIVMAVRASQENAQKERDRQDAQRKAEKAAKEAKARDWANKRDSVLELRADRNEAFGSIPSLLKMAAVHLDRARIELADKAAGPFWDEIEGATRNLARAANVLQVIHSLTTAYQQDATKLPQGYLVDPLPLLKLPDPKPMVRKLESLVRQARNDVSWETVYQIRKGNDIMVRRFDSLEYTIRNVGSMISEDIRSSGQALCEASAAATEQLTSQLETQIKLMETQGTDRRDFEDAMKRKADQAAEALETLERRARTRMH